MSQASREAPLSQAEHVVQFFDDTDTLGGSVARFLHEGLLAGTNALIVATPASVQTIGRGLTRRHVSLQSLIEAGRVTIVDAAATLRSFMNGTRPDPDRFQAVLGTLLQQLAATSPGVPRIYGEMVDILAVEGNFDGAVALEDLWNAAASVAPFALMCGYLAPHFTAAGGQDTMRAICSRHSHVEKHQSDMLATWLLKQAEIV